MNLRNYPRRKYAIDQFTQPHVTELEGEKLHFVMDNGHDYYLAFTGEEDLAWHWDDDGAKHATYFCLKGDDTTYMVSFELDEIMSLSDVIDVIFDGQIVSSIPGKEANENDLGLMMAGGKRS